MKIKASNATGPALDWLVVYLQTLAATGGKTILTEDLMRQAVKNGMASPSTDWAQGGPIIEREGLHLRKSGCKWQCDYWNDITLNFDTSYGSTPLIAAMRRYVASKLGDDVEIPNGLS